MPGAAHHSFLIPCGAMKPLLPRMLCSDPKGFDGFAFHKEFNQSVVAFFKAQLANPTKTKDRSAIGVL